jgi:hypothetical protein
MIEKRRLVAELKTTPDGPDRQAIWQGLKRINNQRKISQSQSFFKSVITIEEVIDYADTHYSGI